MEPTFIRGVQYSDLSSLNTLEICVPSGGHLSNDKSKIWVIFIHGGAWRDPTKLEDIFDKSINLLLASPVASHIAAFASIGYRLSPHTTHPLQPQDPNDPSRNAHHPDHVNDVLDALAYLQRSYGFGDRYVLAGHSAGATLAFQVCIAREWAAFGPHESGEHDDAGKASTEPAKVVLPPRAVLGLEGIYDIAALIAYHASRPYSEIYNAFIDSAFGPRYQRQLRRPQAQEGGETDVWKTVSPTTGLYDSSWKEGKLVVLAHSRQDELVEWEQVELMREALVRQGWGETENGGRRVEMLELKGLHDQVVNEGVEVARAVQKTVEMLAASATTS
ncbi:hypothetical protein AAFC00_005571 [Neodothiora populina]|uniref:Kynurenine formamidase n=1 Tax=Neodothiora populina TaxID=2781224 RepID=A0ABR3PLB0_9PEZI